MIFPWLSGLLRPSKAPITYLFLFLNCLVYLGTYQNFDVADAQLDTYLEDDSFLETQGSAFAVMIAKEPKAFSGPLRALALRASKADSNARRTLGGFALRNSEFMNRAQTYSFGGDEVAVGRWRMRLLEFQKLQDTNPSYLWGLSEKHNSWMHFFTYQFAHAGFAHLFWNMLFMLIFGCFVESRLGGSFVALAYVGGGLAGALLFAKLSGISYSPLVGASGAVSGLIGLVAFGWWKRERVRYLYLLLPTPDYMGVAFLPSWILGIVFLLPDLSSYLSSTKELGSVAYTAHLGGAAFGALMAFAYSRGWLVNEIETPAKSSGDGSSSEDKPDDLRNAS
jgi:membrane associated rhomboid family serine protease